MNVCSNIAIFAGLVEAWSLIIVLTNNSNASLSSLNVKYLDIAFFKKLAYGILRSQYNEY